MKKIIWILVTIFTLSSSLSHASYTSWVDDLIQSGTATSNVVRYNAMIYDQMIKDIELKAQEKNTSTQERNAFILDRLKVLEKRASSQFMLIPFVELLPITEQIKTAFKQALTAVAKSDYEKLLKLTSRARKLLRMIRENGGN